MKCTKEYRLSYTGRAKEIVSQMTLEEKIYLMSGNLTPEDHKKEMQNRMADPLFHYNHKPYEAGGYKKASIPPMKFCDGSRGVACGNGKSTCFPVSMLRGATFDTALEEQIGQAIGEEVRASGGNLFAGICINMPYHPGWGRSQETYGEDSFHLGEMGSALIRGIQSKNVMACVKHFAFYQMEISRMKVNIECDKRTEREVFLSHFKKCIDNNVAVIMSSYNSFRGEFCGHSDYLLNEVLKKEWGFDGFIISDFWYGIWDTVKAANGGQTVEMAFCKYFGDALIKAVQNGTVHECVIDDAAIRIIRTILAFDEADSTVYGEEYLGNKEHIHLALQCAREGIVLLQNENNNLPIKKSGKIVVLGQFCQNIPTGDRGSSLVYPPYVKNPVEAFSTCAPYAQFIFYNGNNISHAKDIARDADQVIFIVGNSYKDEGEYVSEDQVNMEGYSEACGGDRSHLNLRTESIHLIKEVGTINKNSTVVLIGGSTILIDEWKYYVSSILMAFYPGMEGSAALSEIIFGDVNPSGKLPFVIPCNEKDLPSINWDTETQYYDYYHGYAKLEKDHSPISLPYGFGLSYTTFKISNPSFRKEENQIVASCDISNTGCRDGAEIIQVYAGFDHSAISRPVKTLVGFARVPLSVNEKKHVEIKCNLEDLYWYNENTGKMELEHMEYPFFIGTSQDPKDLLKGYLCL